MNGKDLHAKALSVYANEKENKWLSGAPNLNLSRWFRYEMKETGIEVRLDALESDVSDIQNDIDNLQTGKEDVANKAIDFTVVNDILYPSVNAVVNYIDDELVEIESNISDLQTDIANMNNDITNIENSIIDISSDITDLETADLDLQDQINDLSSDIAGLSSIHLLVNGNDYTDFKICKKTFVTSSTSHTIDYSEFGFVTILIPPMLFVERNIANATTACFPILKSYNATQAVVAVAESKTTTVLLLNTAVEGLELVSGITVHITVIGI